MKIPPPRQQLCGCNWLPRIMAKAKLASEGKLPAAYKASLLNADRVDGVFMAHFKLAPEAVKAVCVQSESAVAKWFLELESVTPESIAQWNEVSVNLGRKDYPLEDRFPIAMRNVYSHLANRDITSIFEAIEADEGVESEKT